MHKLTYTPQEYNDLYNILEGANKDPFIKDNYYYYSKNYGKIKHSSIGSILVELRPFKIKTSFINKREHDLYEYLKHTMTQHELQVMYHEPFNNLPLLINHNNKIINLIVLWRLKIGK